MVGDERRCHDRTPARHRAVDLGGAVCSVRDHGSASPEYDQRSGGSRSDDDERGSSRHHMIENPARPSPDLGIVVPAFNEEENLATFVAEMSDALEASGLSFELLFVDDGSTD